MTIDRKETLRYLGYRGTEPDERVLQSVERCEAALLEAAEPRTVWQRFDLHSPAPEVLQIADMTIKSRNLYRNLKGCEAVYLFAATLGLGPDRLVARATAVRISDAVIYQAAAASLIESVCDDLNEELRIKAEAEGLYCRPRFSPGYGDVSIAHQSDFCRLLDTSRKIGLTVTEGDLLVPIKSVTALIGLSAENADCHRKGCEECDKMDCAFRR